MALPNATPGGDRLQLTEQQAVDLIAATSSTSGEALIALFTSDLFPGGTIEERMEAIRVGTSSGSWQYFRGEFDDIGFRFEFQDGGDQVGHFLQGIFMAYDSDNWIEDGLSLRLIVGHEMYGDSGDPSGAGVISGINSLAQLVMGATHPEAIEAFLDSGDENFRYVLEQNPFPYLANGNSMEDPRLSRVAWELGKNCREATSSASKRWGLGCGKMWLLGTKGETRRRPQGERK